MSLSILQVITFAGFILIAAFVIEILFSHARYRAIRSLHERQGKAARRRRGRRGSIGASRKEVIGGRSFRLSGYRSSDARRRRLAAAAAACDLSQSGRSQAANNAGLRIFDRPSD